MLKFLVGCMFGVLLAIACVGADEGTVDKGSDITTTSTTSPTTTVQCEVLLPHADYVTTEMWDAFINQYVPFTNLDYTNGKWIVDGTVIGYGSAEDSEIVNHENCL